MPVQVVRMELAPSKPVRRFASVLAGAFLLASAVLFSSFLPDAASTRNRWFFSQPQLSGTCVHAHTLESAL